jgi:hypothetical protein
MCRNWTCTSSPLFVGKPCDSNSPTKRSAFADDQQLTDDRLVVGGRVREHGVQFHCSLSAGDCVLRQRMGVELAQAIYDTVEQEALVRELHVLATN